MRTRSVLCCLLTAPVVALVSGCSSPDAVTLECSAGDLHHILRIRAAAHEVDDLSAVPAKHGDAMVSGTEYLLRFPEPRDYYELRFRIDMVTGRGTRELYDDEAQLIRGHGGFDNIACVPYREAR